MNRKVKHSLAWELVTVLKTDFFPQMQWRSEAKCRPGPTIKVPPFPPL